MIKSVVCVDVQRVADSGRWRWTSRPVSNRPEEHSPDDYGSALAAITAAQDHFGPGGVSIIV